MEYYDIPKGDANEKNCIRNLRRTKAGVGPTPEPPAALPVDPNFTQEFLNDEADAEDYFLNDPDSKNWLPFSIKCHKPTLYRAARTYQVTIGGGMGGGTGAGKKVSGIFDVTQVRALADIFREAGISLRPPLSATRALSQYEGTPPKTSGAVRRDDVSLGIGVIEPVGTA